MDLPTYLCLVGHRNQTMGQPSSPPFMVELFKVKYTTWS
jgi:hypothetical protein